MSAHPKPTSAAKPPTETIGAAISAKRPVLRFVVLFAIIMGAYLALTVTPVFKEGFASAVLEANARVSAWILRRMGEPAVAFGFNLSTPSANLSIKRGCDALDPLALFIAAILAFPAPWRSKFIGIPIGAAALLLLNLVRIVSLYYVRCWFSEPTFEAVHIDVWQPIFIFAAIGLWVGWAWWATKPGIRPDAAQG